jgi:lipopolysaccharide export system permease protein
MKKILFRKLLFDCLLVVLIFLVGVSLIIWVFQAVNFLDIIIEDGRNANVYLTYTLLNLPKIIGRIIPFAIFFGFTYIFIKYEMNNELIIFWNIGVNKIELINFFLKFSFFLTLIQILFLALIVPKSQEISRSLIKSSDVDFLEDLIKPKRFIDTIKGLTIYTEEKNKDGTLKNIYIKKSSPDGNFQITFAKKGIFENKSNDRILVLYNGQTLNSNKGKITNFSFSQSDFGMSEMDTHATTATKIQEISSMNLFVCLKFLNNKKQMKNMHNCTIQNLRNIYQEIFKRFIKPIYIPSLILISLFLIMKSKEDIKYTRFKFSIFLFGLIIIVLSESSSGYVSNTYLENIKFILIPLSILLFLYISFIYQLKFKFKNLL